MKRPTQAKEQKNLTKEVEKSSLKKVKVSVLALTLLHTSIPMSAFAAGDSRETVAQFTSGSGMRTVIGALNTVTSMSQQMFNQSRMSNAEIQALQSFNKAQGDAQTKLQSRRMHPAFNCPLAPEPILAPNGACSISGNLMIPEQALEFGQNILNEYMSFQKPRNTPPYVGKQCLQDGMKSIKDNFDTMTSQYEAMISNYEAQLKKIAEVQKKNLTKIKELNGLLNGGGNNVSQDFKNTDFNKLLPDTCVQAYDVNTIIKKQGGLVGLKDLMTKDDREAKKFRGNSLVSLRNQIEFDKKKVAANIKKTGITDRNDIFAGTQFLSTFKAARTMASADTTYQTQKVQAMLKNLGISDTDLPDPKDPGFMIKVNRLASKSDSAYQEKFILDCMTGKNAAAYSTPLAKSISSFDHVKLGSSGDALSSFKRAASGAFSDPTSLSALDNTVSSIANSDIRITVTNSSGKSVSKTASQYYADIKNECTAIYNGDLSPAGNVANLETYRAEAKLLKAEAQKLADYAKSVTSASGEGSVIAQIDELIYNCGGKAVDLASCSKDTYNTGDAGFCITQAAACSDNLNQCSTITENLVTQKTQELKQKADMYNAQMQDQENKAKALMAQMQAHMSQVADSTYKQMFPNMTPAAARAFGLPSMPGLQFEGLADLDLPMSDALTKGVLLEKDPEAFLKAMMKNLDDNTKKMKTTLGNWYADQEQHINEQVGSINGAVETEITKWQNFISDCSGAIKNRNDAIAKQKQDAIKAAQDASKEQLEFCSKLRGLQDNGVGPGCDGDHSAQNLYTDAVEIASVLQAQQSRGLASLGQSNSTQIFEQISEYQRLCNRVGKEGILTGGSDKDSENDNLQIACENSGSTAALLELIEERIGENLTPAEKKYKTEIENYITSKTALSEDAKKVITEKTDQLIKSYDRIKNLSKNMEKYAADDEEKGQFGICEALAQDSENYAEVKCKEYKGDDGNTNNEGYRDCTEKKEEKFNENPTVALGITSAAKAISLTMSPGIQNEWNRIGQRYNGTACAAINGSQLGSKGLIPGMLEKINRDLASDGLIQ